MIDNGGINRRQFLAGGAAAAFMLMMGAEELRAQAPTAPAPTGPPVHCGVIGLGAQGRGILTALSKQPGVSVAGICDTYEPSHRRALEIAPGAAATTDYHALLTNPAIDSIFIATPTYLHRQMTLDAVAAGKHVYCEAPLASSIEDAKAIALAGLASTKTFQVGLQARSHPQVLHVRHFVETGVLNTAAEARAQWHRRTSWRGNSPNPDRAKALDWRLTRATSSGLAGEVGIHHFDMGNWFLDKLPVSVFGLGGIRAWPDGRDVYDTIQCILEYPGNIQLGFDATLASSFDSAYDLYMGTEASILLKDNRAWMFKEADSPALGWEVYARKEKVGDEEGIALVADASKQLQLGKKPGDETTSISLDPDQDALNYAVEAFITNVRTNAKPAAGALEGYQATVAAIKANDAINSGSRIVLTPDLFRLTAA